MNRRGFLTGLAGILAAGVAPAFVRAGSLMVPKGGLTVTSAGSGYVSEPVCTFLGEEALANDNLIALLEQRIFVAGSVFVKRFADDLYGMKTEVIEGVYRPSDRAFLTTRHQIEVMK